MGKAHAFSYKPNQNNYYVPLQLIFSDIWGLTPIQSSQGYQFYINFIDTATIFNWVFLMKNKSKVTSIFLTFKSWAEF